MVVPRPVDRVNHMEWHLFLPSDVMTVLAWKCLWLTDGQKGRRDDGDEDRQRKERVEEVRAFILLFLIKKFFCFYLFVLFCGGS